MSETPATTGRFGSCHIDRVTMAKEATLRDHFAAQALQGMLASPRTPGEDPKGPYSAGLYAHLSFALADAMLEARGE